MNERRKTEYVKDYREALVRLQEAQEAFSAAERELKAAEPVEAALKTLLGGRPFADVLTTSRARWRIADELGGWQLPFDNGNMATRVDTLLAFVNMREAVSATERKMWAADLVDLGGELESWRIRLRMDFDDNVIAFVQHYAPGAGFTRVKLPEF